MGNNLLMQCAPQSDCRRTGRLRSAAASSAALGSAPAPRAASVVGVGSPPQLPHPPDILTRLAGFANGRCRLCIAPRSTRFLTTSARSSSATTAASPCGFAAPRLPARCQQVQVAELKSLGELILRAWEHHVKLMVEGPCQATRAHGPDLVQRARADGGVP